ncbi:hypothetical protein FB561_7203 [Kribbella amoyensis]|uniref:Uncharacterized protein n=1 Tax=Kribbella amoyensis TaxID=996641 RepID=A0A561B378_9ACTN|nr:hypothetical protein [Kribbella amoyensis]TWD73314.1 hypothetical protein FB561_7203 [Kribbella amoyensis]
MGDGNTSLVAVQRALEALHASVGKLSQEYGDTLGIRRLVSDVARLSDDLAEVGPPDPRHRPGPVPEELEEISDVEYDASMWTGAETEGFGAPDRRAP